MGCCQKAAILHHPPRGLAQKGCCMLDSKWPSAHCHYCMSSCPGGEVVEGPKDGRQASVTGINVRFGAFKSLRLYPPVTAGHHS